MFGRAILKWIMMASNIAVALIMFMTLLGTIVSPEKFILPAYCTLAFPIIIILNIGFVIFWILTRKWFFLLSLSLLLFSASEINDTFPIHIGKTETIEAKHPIRILSYNTMMSGKLKKHTSKKPNKVIQYILDTDADIVCLQEFDASTKEAHLTHEDMMRIFRKYQYKHVFYGLKYNSKLYGIATFSKYPIVNRNRVKYASSTSISIFSDININGTIIRLFNNHLESNKLTEKDKAMPIQLKDKFNTENLSEVTLHFSRKLSIAYKRRAHQADAVARVIAESPYKVIVCGDFNDVPASYSYTKMKGELKDGFAETGTGLGWTFNETYYRFRIDYVLYDPTAFSLIQFMTDKVNYSDHYPVLCQLEINNPKVPQKGL